MDESAGAGLTADLRLLRLRAGERLLDAGCGAGRHVREAVRHGARAIGVDVDAGALRVARSACPRAGYVLADGARLPFVDGAFHVAVCTEVLEHVADPAACVRELERVLAPGGRLAVSVPTTFTEDLFWRFPGYAPTPGGHLRIFRTGELARLLRAHGFRLYAHRYRNSLASAYWLLRCLRGLCRRGDPLPAVPAPIRRRGRAGLPAALERLGDLVWPKSLVLYAQKPRAAPPRRDRT
jgi:SAM-dependent methyltransferase